MSKRMYWGLATLIILLGTAFVFITIRDRVEIAELKREAADFEKMKAESNQLQTAEVVETRQPPQGASPNGHWHGDEWHDESHVVPITQPVKIERVAVDVPSQDSTGKLLSEMSDEELRKSYSEGFTEEQVARNREIELRAFPQFVEQYKRSIAKSEQLKKSLLYQAEKFPLGKLGQELLEGAQRNIDQKKISLASTQRILEVVYGVK